METPVWGCKAIANLGHWQFVIVVIGLACLLAYEGIRNENERGYVAMFVACALLLLFWLVQCLIPTL